MVKKDRREPVPVKSATLPGSVIPELKRVHNISPPPATTGVPSIKPVKEATSFVTLPITSDARCNSGNFSISSSSMLINLGDHLSLLASIKNEPEASE
ncbi:hypothetical protein ES705_25947 [subsurface metagenome]